MYNKRRANKSLVEGQFTERVKRANAGLWGQLKPEGQLEKKVARRRSKPTFNQDRGCLRKPETIVSRLYSGPG